MGPVAYQRLNGRPLGFAEPVNANDYLTDVEGAKASAKVQKRRNLALVKLDGSAPTIDPLKETTDLAASCRRNCPRPIGALVTASDHARALAKGVKESPKAKREREEAERKREAETDHALTVMLKEKLSRIAG